MHEEAAEQVIYSACTTVKVHYYHIEDIASYASEKTLRPERRASRMWQLETDAEFMSRKMARRRLGVTTSLDK
jgi:hypothetical protein